MTDHDHLAVSRALALAIGWPAARLSEFGGRLLAERHDISWRPRHYFDYRDPAVIWDVAQRFDYFPRRQRTITHTTQANDSWYVDWNQVRTYADTAPLAVAIAVIKAHGGVVWP